MMFTRAFLADRLTSEAKSACANVGVNPENMNSDLFQKIQDMARELNGITQYDIIRRIYDTYTDKKYIKSHLAVVFQQKLPTISKVLSDRSRGSHPEGGIRKLTIEQEQMVIDRVRESQRSGHCVTFSEITQWINSEIKEVSRNYVSMNSRIMEQLRLGSPQVVEELRIAASTYENISNFFERWIAALSRHPYDSDLIINCDETTTNAEQFKSTKKVLFDPNIDIRPITSVPSKMEHVTLNVGISASGKHTLPCFIIKNKSIIAEDELRFTYFNHGSYCVQYSYNGWQEAVM